MRTTWVVSLVASAALILISVMRANGQDAPPSPPGSRPLPVLPETRVEAEQPAGEAAEPNNAVGGGGTFSSPAVEGYRAGSSTAGSIIDLPDLDVPSTVNVVPENLLQDQQAQRLDDVARDAGGVTPGGGDSLFADRLLLRGMELGSRDYRKDGFLDPTYVPRDFQDVDRIEILKGPASMLYGPGSPSGMVNVITKNPLNETFATFGATFGSFNEQRYTLDANAPLTASGDVLFRINVADEDTHSYRDFGYDSRTLVAPSLTWLLDDATQLTWKGEWHRDDSNGDQGVPAINGNPLALPYSRYLGQPANDSLNMEEFRQSLVLTHELDNGWTFELGGSSLFYRFPGSVTAASGNPAPGFFPDAPPPLFYQAQTDIVKDDEQSQSVIANLAGEFTTGEITHKALFGIEYNYFESSSLYNYGALPPIDASNPVYTNPPATPLGTASFPLFQQQRVGGYAQDLVELTPQWKLLGGVRLDAVNFAYDRTLDFGAPVTIDSDQNFYRASPRGAVMYQPWGEDALSLYFSYSQSFEPPGGGVYTNTTPLQPILGQSYELGFKSALTKQLSLNVAGFYTTRQNEDFNTSSFFLEQVGEERAQGVEINLLGNLTDRWSMLANYTYVDARLSDSTDPTVDGMRPPNVPYNSASFWTRYNVIQDNRQTVGVGLGAVYLGERAGNLDNTLSLPGFVRWDTGLFYKRGPFGAALYVENIFDVRYVVSSINEYEVFPGAPTTVRAQVTYTF